MSVQQSDHRTKEVISQYKKRINAVFLSNEIMNKTVIAKQIHAVINKDKSVGGLKDKLVEAMEPFIRGADKRVLITEIPNLLKANDKSLGKYNTIKDILNFVVALEVNNPK